MRYYKFHWNESRGDQYDSWGTSNWFIEVGEDLYPNRQIEIYENGKKLKYSNDKLEDEFGGLSDQKFNESEFDCERSSEQEFEKLWLQ